MDILLFQVLRENFSDYSSQIVTIVASGGDNTPEDFIFANKCNMRSNLPRSLRGCKLKIRIFRRNSPKAEILVITRNNNIEN